MTIKDKEQKSKIQKPYLSLEDAAIYLSYKKSTLHQFTSLKLIPHYKVRRRILFKITELDEWIEKHRVKSAAEVEKEALSIIINEM